MARYPAHQAVLRVPTVASPSVYSSVAALSDLEVVQAHSDEDVSTKGSAKERERYPQGAQHDLTISANFVADDSEEFQTLRAAAESRSNPSIALEVYDGDTTYSGTFQITSWTVSAPAFGAVRGSIALAQVSGPTLV